MKPALLLSFILLFTFKVTAQEITPVDRKMKGYIAIMVGPAFPLGDFGDNDYANNEEAGMAKTGLSLTLIDFGYKFNSNFGVTASWFGGASPVDAQAIADALQRQYGGGWRVESGACGYGGLFAGPLLSFAYDHFDIDIKVTGGFASGIFPELKIYQTSTFLKQSSATGGSWGFGAGGGIRYHLSEKVSFITRVDFMRMKPKADVTITNQYNTTTTESVEQQIQVLAVNVGIAFGLR
ncbi:MAG TPA: hypothetical protein VFW78_00880 [Bacteroidia bacterium]|nr:hypothetical protein [Bacteroidia bacterium]